MPASSVPGSATEWSYVLGEAATVILDPSGAELTVVVIAPHPGWTLERAERGVDGSIEIRLTSASGEVRFEARVADGVIQTSLRTGDDDRRGEGNDDDTSTTVGTGSTAGTTPGSGSTATTIDDHGGASSGRDDQGDDDHGGSSGSGSGQGSDDGGGDDRGGSGHGSDD